MPYGAVIDTKVMEEHITSILRAEDEGSVFIQNVGTYLEIQME
jgi:hypothetical protein